MPSPHLNKRVVLGARYNTRGSGGQPVVWYGLLGLAVVGGLFVTYFWQKKKKIHEAYKIKSAGTAKIGGNWSLVDHNGHPCSNASFSGQYMLIYFGFTFCPDICPEELRKMAIVLDHLNARCPGLVQPLFVSLDPWRDSTDQMKTYVKDFHPDLLGLTGTPAQLEQLAKSFRVYTATDRNFSDTDMEDYVVDHSIFMYLMDKEGKFVDLYGVDKEPEEIIERITAHLVMRGDAQFTLWEQVVNFFTLEE